MKILEAFLMQETLFEYIEEHAAPYMMAEVSLATDWDFAMLRQLPMGIYNAKMEISSYEENVHELKSNFSQYKWLYKSLADEESRETLLNILKYRLSPTPDHLAAMYCTYEPYVDSELIQFGENEIFVDCDCGDGDLAEDFAREHADYGKIYCFDVDEDNADDCADNLRGYDNVEVRVAEVGNANKPSPKTGEPDKISLDMAIKEPVTYLRINRGGREVDALAGAKLHLKKSAPKLAVCAGNVLNGLSEISARILKYNSKYKLYLRSYSYDALDGIVLYGIRYPQGR